MKNDMMLSILVCDDDKYFFEILRDCLCKNMYFNKSDFLYSGNKEDMLKTYRKVKPDLVFMDIEVGEDIGFDLSLIHISEPTRH